MEAQSISHQSRAASLSRQDARNVFILVLLLIAARIAFVLLMPPVYSKDLFSWLRVIDILKSGGNPYSETGVLNWPPFWMQMLFIAGKISVWTSISATHIIQVILVLGEVLCLVVSYGLMKRFFSVGKPFLPLLAGLALNPVSIFLSCQHCNFDVFVGLWILLFTGVLLHHAETKKDVSWLAACFFLGIGILTKTVPLMLAPLLLLTARGKNMSIKLFGTLLLIMPVLIGMSIITTLAPAGVREHVLGYRSMAGWYGIGGILGLLDAAHLTQWYQKLSPYFFLGIIGAVCLRFRRAVLAKEQILLLALLIMMAIPTFGPGYSPPYVLWYLPLLIIAYPVIGKRLRLVIVIWYVIAALTYLFEYALFESHGAFLTQLFPGERMNALSEQVSGRKMQAQIRLPMFAMYLLLFGLSLRRVLKYGAIF